MNSKNIVIVCLLALLSTVCYQVASGNTEIIENFWGISGVSFAAKPEVVNKNGYANKNFVNNTPLLHYNQNPYINTNLLNNDSKALLQSSLSEPMNHAAFNKMGDATNNYVQEPYCGSCNNNGPAVFTVPGNYQAPLSPRFNSEGVRSFIRYDIPEEQNMANIPSDPLTVANMVHDTKENFKADTVKEGNDMVKALRGQGDAVFNELPVSGMNNMVGSENNDEFFVNSERLIFSINKSKLTGHGDWIRGDLPIVPNNGGWFQVSANPTHLNQGALFAMAGVGNVTAQQAAELQGRSQGGTNNTFAGAEINTPPNTFVSDLQNSQMQKVNHLNMANQANLQVQVGGPNPSVNATMFP